ncbi:hypothetical protein EV284_4614 [Streptomyces sp. BK022]|nr:hypothetical protein EV284_4614 [Streptomyces sp. BK022]
MSSNHGVQARVNPVRVRSRGRSNDHGTAPRTRQAHRVHSTGMVLFGIAVRAGAGCVGCPGEPVLDVAQPHDREVEGFHASAGLP